MQPVWDLPFYTKTLYWCFYVAAISKMKSWRWKENAPWFQTVGHDTQTILTWLDILMIKCADKKLTVAIPSPQINCLDAEPAAPSSHFADQNWAFKKKKKGGWSVHFFNSELMWHRALMWAWTYRAQFFIEDVTQVWYGWEDWNVASNTTRNNENTSCQYVSAVTELVYTSVNSPFKECWQLLFQFIINAFIDSLGSAHLFFRLQWRRDRVDGKVLTEWEDMIWHLCPPSLSWRRPASSQSAAPPGGDGRSRSQPVFFPFWKLSPVHGIRQTVLILCVPMFESLVRSVLVLSKCSLWFHCWLCFCLLAACRLTLASGNWLTYVSMVRTAWSNSFTS